MESFSLGFGGTSDFWAYEDGSDIVAYVFGDNLSHTYRDTAILNIELLFENQRSFFQISSLRVLLKQIIEILCLLPSQ